jgi:hypothetical protein
MHTLEPYFNWRGYYTAEDDDRSPFHGREYSEFEFTDAIYDHVLHPQWDNFGSATLYMKLLYADYDGGHAIIELIGEWNDLLYNDIMLLKRDIIDHLIHEGITRFVLIGENVLNFHASDEEYYVEWFEDIEDGWIIGLNFRNHVMDDMRDAQLDWYINLGGRVPTVQLAHLFAHGPLRPPEWAGDAEDRVNLVSGSSL